MIPGQYKQYIPESRMAAYKIPSIINGQRVEPKKIGNVMSGTKQPVHVSINKQR